MGKLVVFHKGTYVLEKPLALGRITVGRRHHNDIVIDNRSVSGEHAAFVKIGAEVFVEDLNSTNGTYVDGERVRRSKISTSSVVAIGTYGVKYVEGSAEVRVGSGLDETIVLRPGLMPRVRQQVPLLPLPAVLEPLEAGPGVTPLSLTKAVTTIGRAGVQVAAIARRPAGYVLTHVHGTAPPMLNGELLALHEVTLKEGDVVGVDGRHWTFRHGVLDIPL